MSLTEIQRDLIARHMAKKLAQDPYAYLAALFGAEARSRISFQPTPYAYALAALRVCEELWRKGDHTWCEGLWAGELSLIAEVQSVFAQHRQFLEEEDRRRREAASADPFSDMLLVRGSAFLDRHSMREGLRRLVHPDGPRILLVNGPAKSGRSYTRTFVEHLAGQLGHFHTAWVSCGGSGALLQPDSLARSIGLQLSKPPGPLPPQEDADARWGEILSLWVLGHDAESPKQWWIVLDGFDGSALAPRTLAFIEQLAWHVCSGAPRQRFRLILLQYPHPLPRNLRREIVPEELPVPMAFGEQQVRDYFTWLFTRRGEKFTPEALTNLVQTVMARVPGTQDRLQHLCEAVEDLTDSLRVGAP